MQQRKRPLRSRSQSTSRTSTRRSPSRRGVAKRRNYERAGLSFVFIGLVIGSLAGLLFWQQVDALSTRGWTYIGLASQYQDQKSSVQDAPQKRIIVNVYACKQSLGKKDGAVELFEVKSYANIVHNSVDTSFVNPRLEILARDSSLQRYATSSPVLLPVAHGTSIETAFTDKAFKANTVLYYGFNNYYQTQTNGSVEYAIGTVSKLIDC